MTKFYKFNVKDYNLPDEATQDQIQEFFLGLSQGQNKSPTFHDQYKQLQHDSGEDRTPVDTIRDFTEGALTGLGKGGQFLNQAMMKIPGVQQSTNKLKQSSPSLAGIMMGGNGSETQQPDID